MTPARWTQDAGPLLLPAAAAHPPPLTAHRFALPAQAVCERHGYDYQKMKDDCDEYFQM